MMEWKIEYNGDEDIHKWQLPQCEWFPLPGENHLFKIQVVDDKVNGIFLEIDGFHGATLDLCNGEPFESVEQAKAHATKIILEYLKKIIDAMTT